MLDHRDSYYATLGETQETISTSPGEIKEKVSALLISHDVSAGLAEEVTEQLSSSPKYTDFVLQFVHSIAEPPPKRAFSCALTIALGYFVGGFIPLVPYFFVSENDVRLGLMCSAIIMICTLFTFGYVKTGVVHGWTGFANKRKAILGGLEMVLIGTVAAGAAMGLVYSFTHD
jgi:VIT1/CCC1 family predicted Fe2+/Mn2+ transporter